MNLYKIQRGKVIIHEGLKWGEEVEYSIYKIDDNKQIVRLGNDALNLLTEFNSGENHEVHLHPEFGNWMIEAVPAEPYTSISLPDVILSCWGKMAKRKEGIRKFLK
jgi:glutamate--cysteine ligase catalytic subunit